MTFLSRDGQGNKMCACVCVFARVRARACVDLLLCVYLFLCLHEEVMQTILSRDGQGGKFCVYIFFGLFCMFGEGGWVSLGVGVWV